MSEPENKSNVAEDNPNKTDPESEEFDPIAALYAENIDLNVPCMDNLSTFENKLKKIGTLEMDITVQLKQNTSSTSASTSKVATTETRRFLPEQGI